VQLDASFLRRIRLSASFLGLFTAGIAAAATPALQIRFDGHRFTPQTLTVPAHRPLVVEVVNASRETIEFESFKLNREVALTPGETVEVRLPALRPGSYDFYDDFHDDVPKGYLLAK
jgi:hypothetical protein